MHRILLLDDGEYPLTTRSKIVSILNSFPNHRCLQLVPLGGTFCGSIADWSLPSRYYTEHNEYNEMISEEISLGSTATTTAPSFTTYDTMHAGEPTFEYSTGP